MSLERWHDILASDYLLASLIPLVLFVLGLQVLGSPKDLLPIIFGNHNARAGAVGHFSVQRAAASYSQYAQLSCAELATMRTSYGRMSWAHRRIGYELGYTRKLTRLEASIATNALVSDAIARLAREQFDEEEPGLFAPEITGDLGRVRESLKHFVRGWSEEGRKEREVIFGPVLDVLRACPREERGGRRVLVPGAGLGRLAWEISELGESPVGCLLSLAVGLGHCMRSQGMHSPCSASPCLGMTYLRCTYTNGTASYALCRRRFRGRLELRLLPSWMPAGPLVFPKL